MFAIRKYVCCTLFGLAAASIASADTVQTGHPNDTDCMAYSQAKLRACFEKQHRASFLALERAQGKARRALSAWDEDDKYIQTAQSRFDAANKAFVHYRETQCAFNAALGGGAVGSATQSRRLACEAKLNFIRIEQLKSAIANLPRE